MGVIPVQKAMKEIGSIGVDAGLPGSFMTSLIMMTMPGRNFATGFAMVTSG